MAININPSYYTIYINIIRLSQTTLNTKNLYGKPIKYTPTYGNMSYHVATLKNPKKTKSETTESRLLPDLKRHDFHIFFPRR